MVIVTDMGVTKRLRFKYFVYLCHRKATRIWGGLAHLPSPVKPGSFPRWKENPCHLLYFMTVNMSVLPYYDHIFQF